MILVTKTVAVHGDDCDGICSAALILIKYPNAKIRFLNPRNIHEVNENFDLVVDLPKPKNCRINIDHHEGNLQRLKKEGKLTSHDIIDPKAPSASSLLIKYLDLTNNEKAQQLVKIANAADTANHTEETLILDKIIKDSIGDERTLLKIAKILAKRGEKFLEDPWLKEKYKKMKEELDSIKAALTNFIESMQVISEFMIIDEIDSIPYHSVKDIAYMLLNRGCRAVVLLYRDKETPSKIRVSIRVSRNEQIFDANKLAQRFNGGGHRRAAGATVDRVEDAIYTLLTVLSSYSHCNSVTYVRLPKFSSKP